MKNLVKLTALLSVLVAVLGCIAVIDCSSDATLGDTSSDAEIDGKQYDTLADAVRDAKSGDTINLIAFTVVLNSQLVIDKSVQIAFSSPTYSIEIRGDFTGPGIKFTSGSSSITGNGLVKDNRTEWHPDLSGLATIAVEGHDTELEFDSKLQTSCPNSGYNTAMEVSNGAKLVLNGSSIFEYSVPSFNGKVDGVGVFGPGEDGKDNPSTLIVKGDTYISVQGYGIFGNGSESGTDYRYTDIEIRDGSITSSKTTGIYHPQVGTLSITGGTITGCTGVEIRSGEIDISGDARIIATDKEIQTLPSGNGITVGGAALAISQHTTDNDIKAVISGGTLVGAYALYETDLMNTDSNNISATITGGTFIGSVGSVYSKDMTGFISGGTYLKGTEESNVPDIMPDVYLTIGSGSEDDDLPPFIPQQSADDDTTLYIACCAAAAVVALLAIIIVMNERKR